MRYGFLFLFFNVEFIEQSDRQAFRMNKILRYGFIPVLIEKFG